jgi:DNA-binding PadR family transcriptional regulator
MLDQETERTRSPSETELADLARRARERDYFDMFQKLLTNMHLFCYKLAENGAFPVRKARNEFRILNRLEKLKKANVYRIAKSLKDAGHYSTILRALRRMEKKGLVRSITVNSKNRRQKTYEVTLLGNAITVLAKENWRHAADEIAQRSSRFLECQRIFQTLGLEYYHYLTYRVIESLMYPTKLREAEADLEQVEQAVTEANVNWLKQKIIPKLSDLAMRSEGLRQIEQLASISWMQSITAQCTEEYILETKNWLKKIEAVRKRTTSAK